MNQHWAHGITETFDDALYAMYLGRTRHQTVAEVNEGVGMEDETSLDGERVWMFVYNAGVSAFAQGDVIVADSSMTLGHGVVSSGVAETPRVLGVAGFAIPAGEYGWIVRSGACRAKSDGSNDPAGTAMTSAASGQTAASAATVAGAKAVIGKALAATGSTAGALYSFQLSLPTP